jgi:hypothetical protein
LEIRYAYNEKFLYGKYLSTNLGTRYPVLDVIFTKGAKDIINSGYDYEKANFSIKQNFNFSPFGHIKYNIFGGKYFGKLPYPLLEVHPGNEYLYYDNNAFEMMNTYEFLSDQFLGFNFEHDLGGGILKYVPLFKKLKFRQFWTAKGLIGSMTSENKELNLHSGFPFRTLEGTPYLELGTGVSNIFNLFRIDFVWRVMPTPLVNEAQSKYFGVFVSMMFEF